MRIEFIKTMLTQFNCGLKIKKSKTNKAYFNLYLNSSEYGLYFITTGSLLHCINKSKEIYSKIA